MYYCRVLTVLNLSLVCVECVSSIKKEGVPIIFPYPSSSRNRCKEQKIF